MTTTLTDDTGKQMVLALNAVTAELQNCLKTVGSTSSTAAIAVVPTGNTSGNPSGNPTVVSPPNIKLNLLLKVADAAAIVIEECRIVNTAPTVLPASRATESWFNYSAEFNPNTTSGIALIGGGEFAGNTVTFLGGNANTTNIKIQDEIIENIKRTIDVNTTKTGQIDPVYLKYDAAAWSVVADGSETDKTIKLTPDIVVGKGADTNKYIICFADESNFIDGTQIKMIDGTTEVTATADTITQINAELAKTDPIPTIKGGRRRRQTRKGGKRYRRKSRRFR